LAVVATSGVARAEPRFALDRFEPAERGSEWFANESLSFRSAAGVVGAWSDLAPVGDRLTAHPGGSFVAWERVRVAASLPVQSFGIGDLRMGSDVRFVDGQRFSAAGGVQVWAPIGRESQWASDGEWRVRGRLLGGGEIGRFVYAAQVGVARRSFGGELAFAGAGGLRIGEWLVVGPEVFGATVFEKGATPIEALLGAHAMLGDIRAGVAAGLGLTDDPGAAERRLVLSLEWAPSSRKRPAPPPPVIPSPPVPPPDTDRDDIPDALDTCPNKAGIPTDEAKTNGCPPDADGDEIDDIADACPTKPGKKTEDPATNGCP
jgi:hypothetical protein